MTGDIHHIYKVGGIYGGGCFYRTGWREWHGESEYGAKASTGFAKEFAAGNV